MSALTMMCLFNKCEEYIDYIITNITAFYNVLKSHFFFSVLSLRVFPSRWSIVNRGWVHHIGAVAPWRKLKGQSSTSTYKLEERLPLSLYRGSRRIYPCFSRSCNARFTVEREQLSSAAMVLIPGQHLRSLSDLSRRYIYTVFARMGKLLSEYIVEK